MKITISCENDEEFARGVSELMPALGEITGGMVAVYIEKGDNTWIDSTKMPVGSEAWEKEVINIVRGNVGLIRRGVKPSEFVMDGDEYLEQLRTGAGMGETFKNLTPSPSPSERGVQSPRDERLRPNYLVVDDLGDGELNEQHIKHLTPAQLLTPPSSEKEGWKVFEALPVTYERRAITFEDLQGMKKLFDELDPPLLRLDDPNMLIELASYLAKPDIDTLVKEKVEKIVDGWKKMPFIPFSPIDEPIKIQGKC